MTLIEAFFDIYYAFFIFVAAGEHDDELLSPKMPLSQNFTLSAFSSPPAML